MTQVATRPTRAGDLIKFEFGLEHGYERDIQTLTVAEAAEIGGVYKDDGAILVAADTTGTAPYTGKVFLLVDDTVYTDGHADASANDYVVIAGGPGGSGAAVVVREQLKFGDTLTESEIDYVVGLLNDQGIKVGEQV